MYQYNTVINAWSHSRSKETCAQKAVSILNKLEALSRAGDIAFRPDRISYNSVIKALARSVEDGAALKAEEYLDKMKTAYDAGDDSVAPDCRTVRLLSVVGLLIIYRYVYLSLIDPTCHVDILFKLLLHEYKRSSSHASMHGQTLMINRPESVQKDFLRINGSCMKGRLMKKSSPIS